MAITEEEVKAIAKLAKLRLTAQEIALYQGQLGKILDAVNELSALDTSGVAPTSCVLSQADALRDDVPEPFEGVEKLLSNAPEREGSYYKVRKVIE